MSDDIVSRLRMTPVLMYTDQFNQSRIDYEACKKYINNEGVKMMRAAADEIERLRAAADEIERLRTVVEAWQTYSSRAERDIAQLRAERDDARRMYCKAVADHYEYVCNAELDGAGPYTQKDAAKDEGWDCFKEDGK